MKKVYTFGEYDNYMLPFSTDLATMANNGADPDTCGEDDIIFYSGQDGAPTRDG